MKILHTADWHLGKKIEGLSRIDEQIAVMEEICSIADAEAVNAVLIAGDVFDTYNPSIEAEELFFKTIYRLSGNGSRVVLVIAGNHDSPDRLTTSDPLAVQNGIFLLGYPHSVIKETKLDSGIEVIRSESGFAEFSLPGCKRNMRFIYTPFANEYRLRKELDIEKQEKEFSEILSEKWKKLSDKYCDKEGVNILASHHFFVSDGYETVESADEEKPIVYVGGTQSISTSHVPKKIDYTALGHLHRFQYIGRKERKVIYSGSPIAYSFAEAEQEKFVIVADFSSRENPSIMPIRLRSGKPLLRKNFENIDEAVLWLSENQNSWVEITVKTENYISSVERKRLIDSHKGIVYIHPEIRNLSVQGFEEFESLNEQNIESLFNKYFLYKNGNEPGKRLKDLFREIIS